MLTQSKRRVTLFDTEASQVFSIPPASLSGPTYKLVNARLSRTSTVLQTLTCHSPDDLVIPGPLPFYCILLHLHVIVELVARVGNACNLRRIAYSILLLVRVSNVGLEFCIIAWQLE